MLVSTEVTVDDASMACAGCAAFPADIATDWEAELEDDVTDDEDEVSVGNIAERIDDLCTGAKLEDCWVGPAENSQPMQVRCTTYALISIDCRQQATDADIMENEVVTGYRNDSMEHIGVRYGWQDEPWYVN